MLIQNLHKTFVIIKKKNNNPWHDNIYMFQPIMIRFIFISSSHFLQDVLLCECLSYKQYHYQQYSTITYYKVWEVCIKTARSCFSSNTKLGTSDARSDENHRIMNSLLQWFVLTEIINKDGSPEEGQRPWLQQKTLHIDPGFYNFNGFKMSPVPVWSIKNQLC